jgi:hypothetical protein
MSPLLNQLGFAGPKKDMKREGTRTKAERGGDRLMRESVVQAEERYIEDGSS